MICKQVPEREPKKWISVFCETALMTRMDHILWFWFRSKTIIELFISPHGVEMMKRTWTLSDRQFVRGRDCS